MLPSNSPLLIVLLLVSAVAVTSHPCDDVHGLLCPEASGFELGDCLLSASSVPPACRKWLDFHSDCGGELERECGRRCEGSPCAYSEDAVPCVALWTHPEARAAYSPSCKAALPVEEVRSGEVTEERKRRSRERKRRRREEEESGQSGPPLGLPDPEAGEEL